MNKPKVVVIVGPTASGKTSLSIELAEKFNGEVISADSRQVYKRLDIGTEKATMEEMGDISHHLIDLVDIETVYNAADFKRDASAAIDRIKANKKLPIVAGGTFFYVDILLGKISTPEVAPNPKLRAELEKKTTTDLFSALLKVDPRRAETIDPDNKRRLMRALEVVAAVEIVPESKPDASKYDALVIGIKTDREILRERIRARAEQALTRGLIEETNELLESGIAKERLSEIGLEYRVVMEHIAGSLSDEELIKKIEEKNWQYAKRQLMWLKRGEDIEWFDREDSENISLRVEEFLNN